MERRSQYRVDLGEETKIEVTVLAGESPPIVARLLNVSADGVAVRIQPEAGRPLSVGLKAQLVFTGARFIKPLTVSAIVRNRLDERGPQRYGFEFTEKEGFDESVVAQALYTLFNRREACRIQPDRSRSIEVFLEGSPDGRRAVATLVDISVTGLAVLVGPQVELAMTEVGRLKLSFHLPKGREPVRLEGLVQNRTLVGTNVRYGIKFEPHLSTNFEAQRALIHGYVISRQEEILRQVMR